MSSGRCEWRHHPQLHAAIGTPKLNPAADTFHPSQAVVEETKRLESPQPKQCVE